MDRIVLDTNGLIQSVSPKSYYYRIWESFFDGTNYLCVTTEILAEYEEILQRLTGLDTAKLVIDLIVSNPFTLFITPYFKYNFITSDPEDNKFVDCAITAGAKFLVTEDRHYDVLKERNFPEVEVVNLDLFLNYLKSKPYRNSEDETISLLNEP